MKGYVVAVVCVTLIGSLITLISPEGDGGGLSRYLKFAVGVCVLAVCIDPIVSVIETIKDFDIGVLSMEEIESGNSEIFDQSYTTYEVANLKSGVKVILKERFGIAETECKITVSIDKENKLNRIFITLYGSAIWKDSGEIEKYFSNLLGCEVVTAVG